MLMVALEPLLASLGLLLGTLGPLLDALGPLLAALGPLLDALGPLLIAFVAENCENFASPIDFYRSWVDFGPPGGSILVIFRRSFAPAGRFARRGSILVPPGGDFNPPRVPGNAL